MKRGTRVWRSVMLAFCSVIGVTALCFLASSSTTRASQQVRVLTEADLSATFGDMCTPCEKRYACIAAFTHGLFQCAYCSTGYEYDRCCDLGKDTTCEYGLTLACGDAVRVIGTISGLPGNCGTCTGTGFVDDGNCGGMRNGEGTMCNACTGI